MKLRDLASKKQRQNKGVCIAEAVILALAILFPLLYIGMDLTVMVLGQSLNEHVAKDAARAAASHNEQQDALKAATSRVMAVKHSDLIADITLDKFEYTSQRSVDIQTIVAVKMPAPFPYFNECKLKARAVAPIVATPADL